MKITACLIAKNEAKNLAETLSSLKNFCDDIVVLDTGSVDLTLEVARKYTDKVYRSKIFNANTTWQQFSFADARNEALSYCTGADWILSVDADETLVCPNPESVRTFLTTAKADSFRMPIRIRGGSGSKINGAVVRIFRNTGTIVWTGTIHEVPTCITEVMIEGIELIHRTQENSDPAKRHRNIVMIHTAFERSNPRNRWFLYFLTQEYYMVENFYAALGAAQLYFDLPYPAMDREWDYAVGLWLTRCNVRLGAMDKAFDMVRILVDEFPHFADAHYLEGDIHAFKGRHNDALACYERTRGMPMPTTRVIAVTTNLYTDEYRSGKMAWVTGMKQEAEYRVDLFKKGILKVA